MVVLPVILLLTAVTYIFYDSHWRHTSRKLSQTISSEIEFIIALRHRYPDEFDTIRKDARTAMQMDVTVLENTQLPTEQKQLFFTALDDILSRELDVSLDEPYWFDISGYGATVEIQVQDGPDVLKIMAERDRTFSTTGHIFIVWVIGATGILIALALGFLRNQVRSILRLTEAAKAYGRGGDGGDYRPSGATEIRDAARAVINMRTRLTAFAEERTTMLAGISHDLRTPLTRIRLQLALMGETEDAQAIRADLVEMEEMIDAYLERHRPRLLGPANDPGTFFVKTAKRSSTDAAYNQTTFYEAWRLAIQRYGIYNPYTGRGVIEGLLPHGPHNVRDVLATHILKQTGSYEQASYAIQDTPEMVAKHYGRFLPQDKAAIAAQILNRVWEPA